MYSKMDSWSDFLEEYEKDAFFYLKEVNPPRTLEETRRLIQERRKKFHEINDRYIAANVTRKFKCAKVRIYPRRKVSWEKLSGGDCTSESASK